MLAALKVLSSAYACQVRVIDVDASESLLALYDELVPVLIGEREGQTVQLCHYFFDEAKVQEFLEAGT